MRQLKINKSITKRDSVSFDKYLMEISKEELITPDEEVKLAQRIRQGDREAHSRLVKANLRFVVSVAKQYQNKGLSLLDLINEGNLGLIKAADRFDETRGFKFISYAVWWIRQSIIQAIAENSRVVRLPLNKIGRISKLHKVFDKLEQEFQRNPTVEEIANELDLSKDDVEHILKISTWSISFDAPFKENEESSLIDVIKNPNSLNADHELIQQSLFIEISRVLDTLTERESNIIRMFFGINRQAISLEEISENIGLTRERVRQIKEKSLRKLRRTSNSKLLKNFLG